MSSAQPNSTIRSFGRKQGRAPKGERQVAMESLLPELSIDLNLSSLDTIEALFSKRFKHYAMEIGFGAGEHLHHQAASNPNWGFIGCEPFLNGVAGLLHQVKQRPIDNIRVWQEDARILLEKLPDRSIDNVFILFPDPWPKTKHHKRRLIKNDLLTELARVMKPSALLRMATDHHDYAAWMLAHILKHPSFLWNATNKRDWQTPPSDWVATRYQEKALASDITTYIDCTRV